MQPTAAGSFSLPPKTVGGFEENCRQTAQSTVVNYLHPGTRKPYGLGAVNSKPM